MKKLLGLSIICIPFLAVSQDCGNFYYFQNNKTIEMSIFSRKGNPDGKQVYTVSGVQNTSNGTVATVNSESFSSSGKSRSKSVNTMTCVNGIMKMDIRMQLSDEQRKKYADADAKVDKVYIEYPADMKAGDNLKDATLHMDMTVNNAPTTVDLHVYNRKVEAKEKVTTGAGDYDCFKITYTTKMVSKTMIGNMGIPVTMNIDGTEWFAPGFGTVKSESKYGSSLLSSVK